MQRDNAIPTGEILDDLMNIQLEILKIVNKYRRRLTAQSPENKDNKNINFKGSFYMYRQLYTQKNADTIKNSFNELKLKFGVDASEKLDFETYFVLIALFFLRHFDKIREKRYEMNVFRNLYEGGYQDSLLDFTNLNIVDGLDIIISKYLLDEKMESFLVSSKYAYEWSENDVLEIIIQSNADRYADFEQRARQNNKNGFQVKQESKERYSVKNRSKRRRGIYESNI
jgi:hypothetical protein